MDGATTTVLQIMVLGLTITEWMSKLREVDIIFHTILIFATCLTFVKYVVDILYSNLISCY